MALKPLRKPWNDALARMDPTRFEALIGEHYRTQGYRVEHVGAEASGQRCDGGIDLKLRRGDEYVIVQCKRWNKQVPHNAVHELIGLTHTERATAAILITCGEFTTAARNAAARMDRLQLIEGDELRAMLGRGPNLDAQAAIELTTRAVDLFLRGRRSRRSLVSSAARGMALAKLIALAATVGVLVIAYHFVFTANRPSARDATTVRSDLQSVLAEPVDAVIGTMQRSTRIADPRRPIDREAARAAVRPIRGVRSAIWLDRTNLIVMVDGSRHRTFGMIDEVCRRLAPLGDTLAVIVNLQDVTATTADGATTLQRNCRLAEGERALFQPKREVDVTSKQLRETFKRMQDE